MYSREMGGIQSDGQLYGMNRPAPVPEREEPAAETFREQKPCKDEPKRKGLLDLSFLHDLKIEDLLLIAIGFLLLTDGDGENNDLLIILVALLLLM
ncbi:MAG: hypothetical protein IKK06_06175 [Clostridia bacterium]|nr:hypothetical protein [Clostridia bacterium]MBR4054374.1 hypothetical protein [Clostridia bacterium]